MKYIRTYDTKEGFLADKDDNSRGFRLKPTLYKYSDVGIESKILLETDDPRKHGDSTYMEITLDSDTEFRFRICPSSTQPTSYTIDWGDGTVETKTVESNTEGDPGFALLHNYKRGSYKIELYDVERNYIIPGHSYFESGYIYPTYSVKRVILSKDGVAQNAQDFIDDDYCAFKDCTNLTSIHIPEGAVRIGSGTFYGCSSLKSINIPEGVTSIECGGSYPTFSGCTSLTSIIIPNSVTSIGTSDGPGAFSNCTSLKSINIPEGVTSIGHNTFEYDELDSISIPESVTTIAPYAFYRASIKSAIFSFATVAPSVDFPGVDTYFYPGGTLHVKRGATGYDAWMNQIGPGWTIVEDL